MGVINAEIIKVGIASCGVASGSREVYQEIENIISKKGLDITLTETGCMGMCFLEPIVEVYSEEHGRVVYGEISSKKARRIIEEHVIKGNPIDDWVIHGDKIETPHDDFLKKQRRIVLRNCGIINPEDIEDYVSRDGYMAIKKVISEFKPETLIEEIKSSGLRGRGGAGFLTGVKWGFARNAPGEDKYIICNADEGDPGAFMDRSVLESDPHSVLEGMAIAGFAVGSSHGLIYVRAEYPMAIRRLKIAIEQAEQRGYIGNNIFDSDFSFKIKIREGAGAFVCGEETALIASVEGKRGMPRFRPPFPAVQGLWQSPTIINNVETLANLPWIVLNGADSYSKYGTEKSSGTKVFALAGKVKRGGLIEVPMGIKIKEIVYEIGGGTSSGKAFKAIQIGGPSGGCIPASLEDTLVDYESVGKTGAIMGSGGMVVMDETTCMVDISKFFLNFTQTESCGKCTFCRIGTLRMLEILERICDGKGGEGDIDLLDELARSIKRSSLCGLGQTAPNPVLTTIKYFREEYEAHIRDKRCPAGVCKELITYSIDPEKCTGCLACIKPCPTDAIEGEKKKLHTLDESKCTRCGACFDICKFEAIVIE